MFNGPLVLIVNYPKAFIPTHEISISLPTHKINMQSVWSTSKMENISWLLSMEYVPGRFAKDFIHVNMY